jgi:hypothetical protein
VAANVSSQPGGAFTGNGYGLQSVHRFLLRFVRESSSWAAEATDMLPGSLGQQLSESANETARCAPTTPRLQQLR